MERWLLLKYPDLYSIEHVFLSNNISIDYQQAAISNNISRTAKKNYLMFNANFQFFQYQVV